MTMFDWLLILTMIFAGGTIVARTLFAGSEKQKSGDSSTEAKPAVDDKEYEEFRRAKKLEEELDEVKRRIKCSFVTGDAELMMKRQMDQYSEEAWDNLERSLLANLADDISVSVKEIFTVSLANSLSAAIIGLHSNFIELSFCRLNR